LRKPSSEFLDFGHHNPTPGHHDGACNGAGISAHHRRPRLLHRAALCDPLANAVFQLAVFEPVAGIPEVLQSPCAPTPATKRPLWLRLLRGTFVTVGKIGLGLFLLFLFAFGPLFVSYWQAQRARATVHVGMTAPEVLHAVTGWSGLQVISHLPDPDNAGINDTLAVSFGNSGDGAYSVYNFATRQSRDISEAEAIAIFQGKLHDGYGWHFLYTYNFFNQLVSFVVVFGPDGRVTQVSLVGHHWG